jgi:hypothetical protein
MKMRVKDNWFKIGEVGVDSGQLILTDPCYMKQWKDDGYHPEDAPDGEYSYSGVCKGTNKNQYVQCQYTMGHNGIAVAFSTGYGDGTYPVFAKRGAEGRIMEVKVLFDWEESDEDEGKG